MGFTISVGVPNRSQRRLFSTSLNILLLYYGEVKRERVRFGSLADILRCESHVRFGSKADMCVATRDVRFTPNSDTKSRHAQTVMLLYP
jgi:hypothetical protein